MVIEETKKIIERMSTEFDKKLSQNTSQKDREHAAVIKMQKHCRDSISQMEQHYQQELMLVKNEHEQMEQSLLERVDEIER